MMPWPEFRPIASSTGLKFRGCRGQLLVSRNNGFVLTIALALADNQLTSHQQGDHLKSSFYPAVAFFDGEMSAQITAEEGSGQQHRQPAPMNIPQQTQCSGAGPIPEYADHYQRMGHGTLIIQAKLAHQPEGDKQTRTGG